MKIRLIVLLAVFVGMVLVATPVIASESPGEDGYATTLDSEDLSLEESELTNDHPSVTSCTCSAIKGGSCRISACPAPRVARCKGYGGAWPEKFPHWCSCTCR